MSTTSKTTKTLTTDDIENGYDDERWLGWGYLGGRSTARRADQDSADAIVLEHATRLGWDYEDLFAWANSKDGRWFADWAFGTDRSPLPWVPALFPKRPAR